LDYPMSENPISDNPTTGKLRYVVYALSGNYHRFVTQ